MGQADSCLESEPRQVDNGTTLLGGLVGTDADTGPVGRSLGIGPWVTILDKGGEELVDHVGVGTAVATALNKGKVVGILDGMCVFLVMIV